MMESLDLEARLMKLGLEEDMVSGPAAGSGSGSRTSCPATRYEMQLKATLKEILKTGLLSDANAATQLSSALAQIIATWQTTKKEKEMEAVIGNALIFLKALGETEEVKDVKEPVFWTTLIQPNLGMIYGFLAHTVCQYCEGRLQDFKGEGDCPAPAGSGGFERHRILGILQKMLRTSIVFLKRDWIQGKNAKKTEESVDFAKKLCTFLDSEVDVGLDIRCSVGLALVYLVLCRFESLAEGVKFFTAIFSGEVEMTKCLQDKDDPFLDMVCQPLKGKEVNRLGLAMGVLCVVDFANESLPLEDCLEVLAKDVLSVDHGTKESLNLGAARVLEMLTGKLAEKTTPANLPQRLAPLFGQFEFFVFSYIPGHIDAVKNCCRNMLSALTKIYDRIQSESLLPHSENLILDLMKKVYWKDSHVKWIGLLCISANSARSISAVLKLDEKISESCLTAKRTCKNPAAECFIHLMQQDFLLCDIENEKKRKEWERRWVSVLFETQAAQNNESNWPQKRQIVSAILKAKQASETNYSKMGDVLLKFVIERMNYSDLEETESTLLVAETIKIASEAGIQIQLDVRKEQEVQEASFRGLVPRNVLNSWLWNENPQVRLAGFSLLAETKKTSELITKEDFESLKILLKYNLVSQNPAFRQQFMAYFKKLLHRMKDSQNLLKRQERKDASCAEKLQAYKDFFVWLWTFLTEDEGLFDGANFGRRCQALDCLWELTNEFSDFSLFGLGAEPGNTKYLIWLIDSYENNKARALEILAKMPIPCFQEESFCSSLLEESISLCESVKPPDSVTGRYLLVLLMKKATNPKYSALSLLRTLLAKLEETFSEIGRKSLTQVSCERPMYGLIRCVKMIINEMDGKDLKEKRSEYSEFFGKLIQLLLKYDETLFPLLGNAAPEGFLPDLDLPDSKEDNCHVVRSITAQMLLVCSWRSMRDICLLFADMCLLLALQGEEEKSILSFEQVLEIGNHMLFLLKNLMHRGVFEQVFVGFKVLATRLWKSSNPKLASLPSKWLNEAMDEEHMSTKCITRRSAGLPFIFQALLSAESDNSSYLADWVERLFIKDESPKYTVVRIHAMNVLRGLFRDANFSKSMMPFVPDGLRIAFRGLKSQDWTERNAGLMLYGAVIRRTFGPKLNLMSAPTFFRRFPQMYDFLLEELNVCLSAIAGGGMNPSDFTFHLLLLLASFAPAGRVEDEHFKLLEFTGKLRMCAESSDIEVRKLAAKALIPFLSGPSDASLVSKILGEMQGKDLSAMKLNLLHGNFVQVEAILKYVQKTEKLVNEIAFQLDSILTSSFLRKVTCATVLESIASVLLSLRDWKHPLLGKLFSSLLEHHSQLFGGLKDRNLVPGLPLADSLVFRGQILFTLGRKEGEGKFESVYEWLRNGTANQGLTEQLLEHFLEYENESFLQIAFNKTEASSLVLLEALISCYLNTQFEFIGQSVLETKFLQVLSSVDGRTLDFWVKSDEIEGLRESLLARLFLLCSGHTATNEHKRFAVIVLIKLCFETEIALSEDEMTKLCLMLAKWTDSSMDDDLRFGVVLGLPSFPFPSLSRFSVIHQCKIWLSVFNLAQDDCFEVRGILNSKIIAGKKEKPACDRRSLDHLVTLFFDRLVTPFPLEGLTTLVGMLLKEDFEIQAEEAHDDEEGRLFDKSEMNMFMEPKILAKIIQSYLTSKDSIRAKLRPHLSSCLSPELVELYELASNSKLFICQPDLQSIINLAKMRVVLAEIEEIEETKDENETCLLNRKFCFDYSLSSRNGMSSDVMEIVYDLLVK